MSPPRSTRRRALHAVACLVLAAVAVPLGAGTAAAHAVLESTDPASGVVLSARPTQVSLTFGEPVQLPPGGLRVLGPDGVEVDDGRAGHPGGAGNVVGVGLAPGTEQGTYTVAWRVISADTHPVSGAFGFSVGHPTTTKAAASASVPSGDPLVAVLYGIVRAFAYAAYAALTGSLALLLFCRPGPPVRAVGARVARAGWIGLLVASVATFLLQGPYGDGTGLGDAFDPAGMAATLHLTLGGALIARVLLLAFLPVYLRQVLRHDRPPGIAPTAVGVVGAVAVAATWSVSGHADVGLQPEIALPADVAHLLAMGVWLGGLLVLGLALRRPDHGRELARTVARFSPIAFGCVVVLVGTGTYQSWRQLGSWSAFVETDYGVLLLVKIVAVVVLLAIADVSRTALQERVPVGVGAATEPDDEPALAILRRSVAIEAVIGLVVLGLTAALVNTEPGRTAEAGAAAVAQAPLQVTVPFDTGGPHGTGTLDVRVDPARTGPDTVTVAVHGPSGALLDPAELDVELSLPAQNLGPFRLTPTRRSTGEYAATGQIPLAGRWELALTVRTSEIDETTVRVPLPVG